MSDLKYVKNYEEFRAYEHANASVEYFIVRVELIGLLNKKVYKKYYDLYEELEKAGFQTHYKSNNKYYELPNGVYAMIAMQADGKSKLKLGYVERIAVKAIEKALKEYYPKSNGKKYTLLVSGPSIPAQKNLDEIDKSEIV